MEKIDIILDARGERYGNFTTMATKIQHLHATIHAGGGYSKLKPYQQHALDMIAVKIGRILTGDPNYTDNWDDIAGYAKLVSNQLHAESEQDSGG